MVDRRPSGQAASGKDTVISSQVAVRSRREWSRRESSDIDEARKGERVGASESIEAQAHAHSKRISDAQSLEERSRRESNPHLRFRKPLFYPLNYGNSDICDFRVSIGDCK